MADYFTQAGATELAARITKYWKAKGYESIACWAEQAPYSSGPGYKRDKETGEKRFAIVEVPSHWVVRSNMTNGMPR